MLLKYIYNFVSTAGGALMSGRFAPQAVIRASERGLAAQEIAQRRNAQRHQVEQASKGAPQRWSASSF
jgi:hypothetical protein